jgi:hypothetical protein
MAEGNFSETSVNIYNYTSRHFLGGLILYQYNRETLKFEFSILFLESEYTSIETPGAGLAHVTVPYIVKSCLFKAVGSVFTVQ